MNRLMSQSSPKFYPAVMAALLGSATLLSGCATRSIGEEQVHIQASASLPEARSYWTSARQRVGNVKVGWIYTFDDTLLVALVEEAIQNNRNLRAAGANVRRARGLAQQAGAALVPKIDVSGGAQRNQRLEGKSFTAFSAGAQLSWEVDLWNRIGASEQATVESARSAEADYLFSQYSIAAAVAQSYFIVIEADQQTAVAQGIVDALIEINRIVQQRYRYGFASAYDVSLSKSDLASAMDSLASAQNGKLEALRALEALLGRYPSADLKTPAKLPEAPAAPGAGIPSDLLERRPDIIAAERNIAAALNSLQAAKAAKLPIIQLTGSLGSTSTELANLLDPVNILTSLGANLFAPIFDGGARQSQVDISQADVEAAVAIYADTAITAFAEVESALDRGLYLRNRGAALKISDVETRNALRLSLLQYKEGQIDLIDVLSIQQRVFLAQSNLLSIKRAQLDQYLELNLALGGDWNTVGASD